MAFFFAFRPPLQDHWSESYRSSSDEGHPGMLPTDALQPRVLYMKRSRRTGRLTQSERCMVSAVVDYDLLLKNQKHVIV